MIRSLEIPFDDVNEEKFFSYISDPDSNDCMNWLGYVDRHGYGSFRILKKMYLSHRVMWSLINQKQIPSGLYVCHACDNPSCCNPDHFFIGTAKENVRDCIDKGRFDFGHQLTILSDEDIPCIRDLWSSGCTASDISIKYGVSVSCIESIVYGNRWSSVAGYEKCYHGKVIGEKHPMSRLDRLKVIEMRDKYASGKYTYQQLADDYCIGYNTAFSAITRLTWKHV